MCKFIFLSIAILTSFGLVIAQDVVQYDIKGNMIEDISIVDYEEEVFSVVVKLKDKYAEEFADFTRKYKGNYLIVKYYDIVLVEAFIMGTIDSGIITVGEWKSFENAKDALNAIQKEKK